MQKITHMLPTAARLLLGAGFVLFGLNGFVGFLPMPDHPGEAGAFLGALAATGYMFPLIKGTELVVGLLLLAGRYVPLALTLLAPIMINIVAFHLALEPATVAVPLVLLALHLYVAWTYRASFRGVLAAKAQPQAADGNVLEVGRPATQTVA